MKAKQREKRAQSSAQLKRYHAQQRALKELNAADGYGDAAMPMLIQQGGRRIIDIMLFARNMWCTDCNIPLSLRNLVKEKQFGIASRFYVRCSQCLKEIAVDSSASVPDVSKQGRSLFAVNCKAALGMFTFSSFCLCSMYLPCLSGTPNLNWLVLFRLH